MSKIKVVSFDPSLNNFGIVKATIDSETLEIVVDEMILAQPAKADKQAKKSVRKNSDDLRRARWLQANMRDACKGASVAMAEVPVGSQSARAMASYGICIGVLSSCKLPLIEVTPNEVKIISVGKKTASKAEMIAWATEKHPEANWKTRKLKGETVLTNDNEHLADAVAAIYAGIHSEQFKATVAMVNSIQAAA